MKDDSPSPEGWPADMTWPPRQSLDDAFDKLRWAKKHLKALRVQIEAVEQRDTHSIRFKLDADAGKYTFYVHNLEDVSKPDWPLMIGDSLHNARTALDYLMVRLFALVTGKDPRFIGGVQFPLYDHPKRFAGATAEARKHRDFSGYLARIEELQPFNLNNPSIWGTEQGSGLPVEIIPQPVRHALPIALDQLSALDNIDKHRVIHTTWLGAKIGRIEHLPVEIPAFIPPAFEHRASSRNLGPLENDAEIGSMEFATPLPHEWNPSEVDMKRYFPLQVSLVDESRFPDGVLEVLRLCIWGAEAVLALFVPVFANGEPPLPVTAIPNPWPRSHPGDPLGFNLPG